MDAVSFPGLLWLIGVAAVSFLIGRQIGRSERDDRSLEMKAFEASRKAADAMATLSSEARGDIDALLYEKKTIHAIKRVRGETGLDLKDSKDAVEARARELGVR